MTSTTQSSPVRPSQQRSIRQCATTKRVCRPMHLLMIAGWLVFCAHDNYMGNSKAMIPLCYANPLPTPLILPSSQSASLLSTASDNDGDRLSFDRMAAAAMQTNRVGNLTRQHGGDVFYAFGEFSFILIIHTNNKIKTFKLYQSDCLRGGEKYLGVQTKSI